MSKLDDESYNTPKSIATFVRVSSIAKNLLIPSPLNYHAVRRLVVADGDEVEANENADDELAEMIVDAAESLAHTERVGNSEVEVDPGASLAALFDGECADAKELKPRLWCAVDMSDTPSICSLLVACEWSRDETLSTSRFTTAYCREHSLPRFNASTLLIDVVASSGTPRGAGALLVLACYLLVCRSRKYERVATIAVTSAGKSLFARLGFEVHNFREGTPRALCWADAGTLKAADIHRRLRWDVAVQDLCFRKGYTRANSDKRYARC